jgi:ubiquinone/menaquinone biosynthesis C-methylase UbiE
MARQYRSRFSALRRIAQQAQDASEGPGIKEWAQLFDRAAKVSPEASVALYSLGDPALLDEATREVSTALRRWGLLGRDRVALDIGCGIGRFEAALAPELGFILGLDISAEMLMRARSRCADLPNAAFLQSDGRNLATIASGCLDLVLAIDSFPYVVACGERATQALLSEIARVLRLGGDVLIANFSYRGDIARDRAELLSDAQAAGLVEKRHHPRPFRSWDGVVFQLGKP